MAATFAAYPHQQVPAFPTACSELDDQDVRATVGGNYTGGGVSPTKGSVDARELSGELIASSGEETWTA